MFGGRQMKSQLGVCFLVLALLVTACGRDEQGGAPAPSSPNNPPIVNNNPPPSSGGVQQGGYCGPLCRWRQRRQQHRQPC